LGPIASTLKITPRTTSPILECGLIKTGSDDKEDSSDEETTINEPRKNILQNRLSKNQSKFAGT
jgi:hypothetical protein